MSNIKARLMKPTGLEFHETAFEIDREIWNFIKHEYKNKDKDGAGNLPVRYWQTHGVPLHRECWRMIAEITYANSIYPTTEEELSDRKRHQQQAIGCCQNLFQLLRLTLNELPNINADRLANVLMLPNRKSFTRIRRKLRSFKGLVERGEMAIEMVNTCYQSWRGYQIHFHSHKALRQMDTYYHELLGVWPGERRGA